MFVMRKIFVSGVFLVSVFCSAVTLEEFEASLQGRSSDLTSICDYFTANTSVFSREMSKNLILDALNYLQALYENDLEFSSIKKKLLCRNMLHAVRTARDALIFGTDFLKLFSDILTSLPDYYAEKPRRFRVVASRIVDIKNSFNQIRGYDFIRNKESYNPVDKTTDTLKELEDEAFCRLLELYFFNNFLKFSEKTSFKATPLGTLMASEAYFALKFLEEKRPPSSGECSSSSQTLTPEKRGPVTAAVSDSN